MKPQDLPQYKQGQHYNLGTDREKAQSGLDYINSFCPVLNMQNWQLALKEGLNGCFYISRIPDCRLVEAIESGGFTWADAFYFVETYVESIDDYDSALFSQASEP